MFIYLAKFRQIWSHCCWAIRRKWVFVVGKVMELHHWNLQTPSSMAATPKIRCTKNYALTWTMNKKVHFIDVIYMHAWYMYTTGSDRNQIGTLLMHWCNTHYTKIFAWVIIEGKSAEDAPRQILTQCGSMDHMDVGWATLVRDRKEGGLCFLLLHLPTFMCKCMKINF